MVVKLLRPAYRVGSCEYYSGIAAGDLTKEDAKVAAIGDAPVGFVIDEIRTDNPPRMVDVHGTGAIISGLISAGTVGSLVYSDGDGTISTSVPAGAAGTKVYIVGTIIGDEDASTSDIVEINIYAIQKGA